MGLQAISEMIFIADIFRCVMSHHFASPISLKLDTVSVVV